MRWPVFLDVARNQRITRRGKGGEGANSRKKAKGPYPRDEPCDASVFDISA
jgi:hypothetical protein